MKQQAVRFLILVSLLLTGIFRFRRWLIARVLRLTPPRYGVMVTPAVRMTMPDGVTLIGDAYRPAAAGRWPTILLRTPYGRSAKVSAFGYLNAFVAQRFAERGYAVVVQDTRGRSSSEGVFNPYWDERVDGRATLDWIKAQPWCSGVIGLWGASYSGIVQWTIVTEAPEVKAFVPALTASNLQSILYPDGAFDLGLALRWLTIFRLIDRKAGKPLWYWIGTFFEMERALKPALLHLPLGDMDDLVLHETRDYYRYWLEHAETDDSVWGEAFAHIQLERLGAPAHFIAGWYDFFLRAQLQDYARLRAAGQQPYLTIGPWFHLQALVSMTDLREGLAWFDTYLKGQSNRLRRSPVRVFVMGANQWRDLPDWPPSSMSERFYLTAAHRLNPTPPTQPAPPSRYRYDPANPTPIIGGTQFGLNAGPRDNRRLERRRDVLTFKGAPLEADLDVIGHVMLELYVRSSVEHTDFFGRLCDRHPDGRVINLCGGLFRIRPGVGECLPDGVRKIQIDLWATAHRFRAGHCIELIVTSGAHPRWSRNPGTGEPLMTGTHLQAADQSVYHDEAHPSALILPVVS